MKPCFRNRKLIAWLVLGELDPPRAEALDAHTRHCPGCRRYLEEMSAVAGRLAAGPAEPELEPCASFHRNLLERLRGEETPSAWATLFARLNRRLTLPALGAAVLLVVMLSLLPHAAVRTPPVRVNHLAASPLTPARDLSPTIANYERAASGSLDDFDDLLTQQARQHLPAAPAFTASFVPAAGISD